MMASSEDDMMNSEPEIEEDNLFGDDDEELKADEPRELDDEELDSGDDMGRDDRRKSAQDMIDEGVSHDLRIAEHAVSRHPLPKPVDSEYNSLRMPKFLSIEPRVYTPESFEPPKKDHHLDAPSTTFSANATAATTMRYRKDPMGNLESNTLVYKWSDGSTTIAVGDQHYELQTKPLAPPKDAKSYLEVQDSHQYLATPSLAAQMLVLFGHMTNEYTVRPNKEIADDALEKLQKSLAKAAARGHNKNGPELIINQEDPELQKKRAEAAEKEQLRVQRRRENAAEKAGQGTRSRAGAGNLTVDDLEGGRRRGPATGRKSGGVKRTRRRADYDSDDDLPRGRGREDEYDKEDDFLADSDEELDEGGDDDDEEELLDDESDKEERRAKKQKTTRQEDSDADADAEADLDDDEVSAPQASTEGPSGRGRNRNVIEDDDDE